MSTALEAAAKWGEIIDGQKHYPCHQGQLDVLASKARFTAAIAGTGGGKTVCGPLWLAEQIKRVVESKRKFLGMVVAPTYKVLSRATLPTLIETFNGTALQGTFKETKNLYVLPNNWGLIWCQGADNPGGLEGGQFDAVWLDEGGQVKLSVWIALQGRTGAKQAPIFITTTPYGLNWLYTEVYKRFKENDKNYYVRQWASKVNPAYPEEEYNRAKGSMTAEKAAMRYDGEFMKLEGLVYPSFSECAVYADPEDIIDLGGKFVGGIDFGWNDPFAALCGNVDRNDVLWIWYERYKSETMIEDHADALPKLENHSIRWFSEHTPEFIKKLKKGGHRVRKANKAITVGIEAVNARILTGRLKILKNRCPACFAEADTYIYPEDDEVIVGDKPVDKDNHCMDALRYLICGLDVKKPA